jgi:hypothetical protein
MRSLPAIIDGQRNILTGFYQDHHEKEWYIRASEYLRERRTFVQKRFIECTRYVDVHSGNSETFSYEFASILRDCGSVFSSVLDAMIKGLTPGKKQTTIADYKSFLKTQDDTVYLYSVHYRSRFPDGLILPLYSLKNSKAPGWWDAYNEVKHSEYDAYRSGNLGNATTALASLVILETMLICKMRSDELWTNIGLQYEEGSYDMGTMKRLFHKSE